MLSNVSHLAWLGLPFLILSRHAPCFYHVLSSFALPCLCVVVPCVGFALHYLDIALLFLDLPCFVLPLPLVFPCLALPCLCHDLSSIVFAMTCLTWQLPCLVFALSYLVIALPCLVFALSYLDFPFLDFPCVVLPYLDFLRLCLLIGVVLPLLWLSLIIPLPFLCFASTCLAMSCHFLALLFLNFSMSRPFL